MKRCASCVLPVTYPGISLNEKGVCKRCLVKHEVIPLGEQALLHLLDHHSSGRYDALLALSGGRDSVYALYYAVKILNLDVLAFTIDNGFIPQQTWQNIENAVTTLDVEHVILKHRAVKKNFKPILMAWLQHPSPAMIPTLCTGCRLGLNRGYHQVVERYQTPLLIVGSGEPESSFALKFFQTSEEAPVTKKLFALLQGFGNEFVHNPWYFRFRPGLLYWLFLEYVYAYSPQALRQRISPAQMTQIRLFEYIGWDESEIMSVIQKELGWVNYSQSKSAWRSDCKISLLKNHLYYRTLGFTKNDELISNMIRLGDVSRSDGLERVEHENIISEAFLEAFMAETNISKDTYAEGLRKADDYYQMLRLRAC